MPNIPSDRRADQRPANRIAPHQRKIHRNQQRQLQICQVPEEQRNVHLKRNRRQRNENQPDHPELGDLPAARIVD
jgi:hypothetical protein